MPPIAARYARQILFYHDILSRVVMRVELLRHAAPLLRLSICCRYILRATVTLYCCYIVAKIDRDIHVLRRREAQRYAVMRVNSLMRDMQPMRAR